MSWTKEQATEKVKKLVVAEIKKLAFTYQNDMVYLKINSLNFIMFKVLTLFDNMTGSRKTNSKFWVKFLPIDF